MTQRLGLKRVVKRRLIDELVKAVQSSHMKIVVVDEHTLPIFSHACGMLDLIEENVTLIEKLEMGRKPFSELDAIYFITPNATSINYLLNDLSAPADGSVNTNQYPKYHAAHVFFSSTVADDLMTLISASPGVDHIKTMVELQLEFLTTETNVFTTLFPETFYEMFSPNATKLRAILPMIARRLATVCLSISQLSPIIRYHQAISERTRCTGQLATMLADELRTLSETTKKSNGTTPRATVLILDRTMDMSTPFLHELTYQAMAADIIPLANGTTYTFEYINAQSAKVKKDVRLDETRDDLWEKLRHAHMATVIETVNSEFSQFRQQNTAARGLPANAKATNKELAEYLRAMPEYQDQVTKYSLHVNLASQCMKKYHELKLAESMAIEQDIATGYSKSGDRTKNAVKDISTILLTKTSMSSVDKLRLILVYLLSSQELTESEKDKVLDVAKLTMDELRVIDNVTFLQAAMMIAPEQQTRLQKKKYAALEKLEESSSVYSQELSRYIPTLRMVLDDIFAGTLSTEDYPYVDVRDDSSTTTTSKQQTPSNVESTTNNVSVINSNTPSGHLPLSARTTRTAWQSVEDTFSLGKSSKKKSMVTAEERVEGMGDSPPLIVFVLGGITYSEMRVIYEMMQKMRGKDIYLGSTSIWTPQDFVGQVAQLNQAT